MVQDQPRLLQHHRTAVSGGDADVGVLLQESGLVLLDMSLLLSGGLLVDQGEVLVLEVDQEPVEDEEMKERTGVHDIHPNCSLYCERMGTCFRLWAGSRSLPANFCSSWG